MDLDDFKPINDNYGHPAGDAVLNTYAKKVLTSFRQHDMVARYGGEEFAVIFPNTESLGALRALEKVQQRAAETICVHDKGSIPLPTFSAGLAVYHQGETMDALIKRADNALYRAKDQGRNCIVTA
jgi:diguanylate cyclase (GGDEF)-like protein